MLPIPQETICKTCKRIFCCANCRRKHELKTHAIHLKQSNSKFKEPHGEPNYIFCPICEQKPLLLREEMFVELLQHIKQKHLPLRCQKCDKIYAKIDDIKEFSKCLQPASVPCQTQAQVSTASSDQTGVTDASKVTAVPAKSTISLQSNSIATQTTPMLLTRSLSLGATHSGTTPLSTLNIDWQAKGKKKEELLSNSDSVSSIKNASSLDNSALKRSIVLPPDVKGKLVRSTSTPVHGELMLSKPKEQHFHASAVHVSSIYNSANESDQHSPLTANANGTSNKAAPTLDNNTNRYLKVVNRPKITAVTPLRQVMSKSIQKAFAEHGMSAQLAQAQAQVQVQAQRNQSKEQIFSKDVSAMALPLDLRVSPVVRRAQNDFVHNLNSKVQHSAEILLSAQRLTRESIVITRTQQLSSIETNAILAAANSPNEINSSVCSTGSIYKTCSSVQEIITSSDTGQLSIQRNSYTSIHTLSQAKATTTELSSLTPITRIPGAAINKKLIKFDTPAPKCKQSSPAEKFYTPKTITPEGKKNHNNSSGNKSVEIQRRGQPRSLNAHFSPSRRPSLKSCHANPVFNQTIDLDDVFMPGTPTTTALATAETETVYKPKNMQHGSGGRLWSLMSSVMRLPNKVSSQELPEVGKTFIRRCASIAGSLVRSKSTAADNDEQLKSLKRKRTNTLDSIPQLSTCQQRGGADESISPNSSELSTSKRYRIHGRKPIERMRKLS